MRRRLDALEAEREAGKSAGVPEKWYDRVKIGAGFRSTFRSFEPPSAAGKDTYSRDFALESGRLYASLSITDMVSAELNTEVSADSDGTTEVTILDAVAKFKVQDELQVWFGRFLPPSDRSNLDGPYSLATWDFPLVQAYPAIFAGRDDGLAVWGEFDRGRWKYQFGVFEGRDNVDPDNTDHVEFTGRLSAGLLDPESGYYTQSTYYGTKDVLTIAVVGFFQQAVEGVAGDAENFFGWNVDVLFEKKFGAGTATLEGAFYSYDRGDYDGHAAAWFVLTGFLVPEKIGIGFLQPHVRFQSFDEDADPANLGLGQANVDVERVDVGVNYVIDGHNARLSLIYVVQSSETEDPSDDKDVIHGLIFGGQFQL